MEPIANSDHASLERIPVLLKELRSHPVLREDRPGVFFVGPREVLHFHSTEAGVVADLRLGSGFVRVPVTTEAEQLDLLARVDEGLASAESRREDRRRRPRRRRSGG